MEIKLGKAEERGKTKGISIGEIRGANNKTVELAKRMLKENISADIVSKVTGLSKQILRTIL